MKVYLSGPMTGLPDYNYPAFNAAAAKLRALGFDVDNPAEHHGGAQDLDRAVYMRSDIESLLKVHAVALLPGWGNSKGATLEVNIARELGLRIFDVADAMHHTWLNR